MYSNFGFQLRSGLPGPDFFCVPACAAALAMAFAATLLLPAHAAAPDAPTGTGDTTIVIERGKPNETGAPQPALPRVRLDIGGRRVIAEVAANERSRSHGLMFRQYLAPDAGMLFVFPEAMQACFWMKNTPLPLSIAFIDSHGTIINLSDMHPQSLDTHCPLAPALYALEMEQGWFARNGIGPGTQIRGLPRLVKPK